MADFVMPHLGADMTTGKLLTWRKSPGERIERGEIIAEVHTDKADIEVESFTSGVIEKFLIQPGDEVPVGTVIAIIRVEGEAIPERPERLVEARPVETGRIKISPVAKNLAAELGIDPATVQGSGPGGRITREDIEKAAALRQSEERPKVQTEPEVERQSGIRQIIASAMARSKREIPHYYLSTTIDLTPALSWLAEENKKRSVEDRLLYGILFIKAVALALRQVPELNSTWSNGKVRLNPAINIGVAISLRQGGLIAPALLNVDQKSLDQLMNEFRDLVKRARAGSLRSSEISDSTITITSLGEQGVEAVFGIIYPPQVALVGFGKVVERPWSVNGQIVSRQVVTATLSADHRVSDGHRGGLFLAAVDRLLQSPQEIDRINRIPPD